MIMKTFEILLLMEHHVNMVSQSTITKRIAKHGKQAIIVVPKLLEEHLKPGAIVELKIEIIRSI